MSGPIVVTGAAGLLGSRLVGQLLGEGHDVVGVDSFLTGHPERLAGALSTGRFTLLERDAASADWHGDPSLARVQAIYHLASPAAPYAYRANALATIEVNTNGTARLLELARERGASFLFASTSEVYGEPDEHPQSESGAGRVRTTGPRACYSESKRMGEVIVREHALAHGVRTVVVRIFNAYADDPFVDDGRAIGRFVRQALAGEDLTVNGDGSQTRSFCHAEDTVRGLRLAMAYGAERSGQVFNIGNPEEVTIAGLARLVLRLTGSPSRIVSRPLPDDDPTRRQPDIAKAGALLGWRPTIGLEQGLRATIERLREAARQ